MNEPALPEESIFLNALDIEPGAERVAYLDRACGDDPGLRAVVEALLGAHEESGDLLDLPEAAGITVDDPNREHPGTLIGPYKLVEKIGEGGMGVVWLAQQTDPVRRLVALKVIKAGMDSAQVIARFEAERQALALMDHPNIARVLDAGTTERGRPYFVMELVKGVPITKYCDDQRLTPVQRLGLFVPVCQAIQHAHQKGIIHRDVKPSNVLVAPYDGVPVVKVIDFGVAKAIGQQLTERTLVTGLGALVGTLEYMSPEQAELNNRDIDTRSDVYSLGVLLYELLTGSTPLTKDRLKQTPLPEALRLIREQDPPKPSTRLSESKESLPAISEQRQTEPAKLTRLVRGELDWIVMKALEKDRERRYETANGLAKDVERYLADEPVEACPPSAAYRLRKFARKHRRLLASAGAFLGLLVLGVIGLVIGLVTVNREQHKTRTALAAESTAKAQARESLDTLMDGVVETMFARQPELGETEKAFLRKVLASYEAITQELGETAEARFVRARGFFKVARLHMLLGDGPQAEAEYRQAVSLLEQLVAEFTDIAEYSHRLAASYHQLAILLAEREERGEAEKAFRRAITLHQQLADDFSDQAPYRAGLASDYFDLGFWLQRERKYADAEKAYRQALDLNDQLAARSPGYRPALARARSKVGDVLRAQVRYLEAEELFRQALPVQQKQVAEFPAVPLGRRHLAESYRGLGIVLLELRERAEAESAFRLALDLHKRLADDFPTVLSYRRDLAAAYNDLGAALLRLGKYADAEAAYHQALELKKKLVADSGGVARYREELARSYMGLGHVLRDQKKSAEAETAYRQSLAYHTQLADEFPDVVRYQLDLAGIQFLLGQLFRMQRQPANALLWYDQALARMRLLHQHPQHDLATRALRGSIHHDRALALDALKRSAEALADWDRAVELASPADRLRVRLGRARAWVRAGKVAEAVAEVEALTRDPATPNPQLCTAAGICALASAAAQDASQREAYAGRALALLRRAATAGFFADPANVERLKRDADLVPLRPREDFRKFVTEMATAAKS